MPATNTSTDKHEHAREQVSAAHQRLANESGEIPTLNEGTDGWVERITRSRVDQDPRVPDAEHQHREARDTFLSRPQHAQEARLTAYARIFGPEAVSRNRHAYLSANPAQQAGRAAEVARHAKEEAELLRSLTPTEAASRIEQTRAAHVALAAEKTKWERASQEFEQRHQSMPGQGGVSRGL